MQSMCLPVSSCLLFVARAAAWDYRTVCCGNSTPFYRAADTAATCSPP